MVAIFLPADHDPRPWGQKVKIHFFSFSKYRRVAYLIKGNDACSSKVTNILPADPPHPPPPPTLGVGSKVKFYFSVYGHVASQIKGNDACNNVVADILPADHPHDLGGGVKNHFFLRKCTCCKWKHECSNMVANILSADPPPPSPRHLDPGVKRSKFDFFF